MEKSYSYEELKTILLNTLFYDGFKPEHDEDIKAELDKLDAFMEKYNRNPTLRKEIGLLAKDNQKDIIVEKILTI